MEITSEVLASCAVVRPVGTLDRRTAPQLEAALQALSNQGHSRIVLDLSGVSEMSSAGLRVIISVAKLLRNDRTGGDLRLVAPGERVVHVLELAGLQSVLRVYGSTGQATASFDQPAASAKKRP
jgi:anti-sigma B factor antagonist